MKVNKQKFIDAIDYIKQINKCKLEDLDFSDFTLVNLDKLISEWKYSGMDNKLFISMMLIDKDAT